MSEAAGKTIVITGATTGIGLHTAMGLAAAGGRLVLVGHDRNRGEAAMARLKEFAPRADVQMHHADLSNLDDLRRLAAELAALERIDVLINNAGAIFKRRGITSDGLERTFALNHMAYFALTMLLRDRLVASAPARIVNVASEAHRGVTLDFADLQNERGYSGWLAYRRSKLCNILFTRELARRLAGTGVTANCLHPGFVASRFGDDNSGAFRVGIRIAKAIFAISPERGARTSIYLAASPEVADVTGRYFIRSAGAEPSIAGTDDSAANRLWELSANLLAH